MQQSMFDGDSFSRVLPSEAIAFILPRHYSGRKPNIMYSFGCFVSGSMVGACTFGKPASNSLCKGICGAEYSDRVVELNRLCIEDGSGIKLSRFVGWCLRQLKTKNLIIVSYSDTQMNHHGYIYQATNWLYTGKTKERTDIFAGHGKHSRHYGDRDKSKRLFRSAKHRYVYFACDKRHRREYRKSLNYPVMPYPKGDNERYTLGEYIKPIVL